MLRDEKTDGRTPAVVFDVFATAVIEDFAKLDDAADQVAEHARALFVAAMKGTTTVKGRVFIRLANQNAV